MKYKWLNKENNERLIIFFNGWGMDESVVNHLEADDFDVIMFYDYNSLDIDLSVIEGYKEKYLIAWSMGVMVASLFNIEYKSKTAVNGTLDPIHNEFGIPERIYNLTIKGFSPLGCKRFIQNMFNKKVEDFSVNREFKEQKSELSALKGYKANKEFKYDRVFISTEDKIIPTANQVKFWEINPNITGGHAPFSQFKSWSELL